MKTEYAETEHGWKPLFNLGGVSALMMVGIIIAQMIVFMSAPPPYEGGASAWFTLFQNNKIIGLINFELLMIVYVFLSIPITLSLYILLRRVSPSFTALYVVLSLIGIMSFIVARPAFEMLSLSNGYAAATTPRTYETGPRRFAHGSASGFAPEKSSAAAKSTAPSTPARQPAPQRP